MPFVLTPVEAVHGIIKFDIPLNEKLHRRATTKLEDRLYNFVPHDLFIFPELLNNRGTKLQWSDNVKMMIISKDVLDANMDYVNLLINHGEVNLDMI